MISSHTLEIVFQLFQVLSVWFSEFRSSLFGFGRLGSVLWRSVGRVRTGFGGGCDCDWTRDGHRILLSYDHLF